MTVHLLKLCVGISEIAELEASVTRRMAQAEANGLASTYRHVTRQTPRRSDELLDGGSLFWVIKGTIQARQKIVGLEELIGEDNIRRCAIHLSPEVVATQAVPRRAFQGWRYLNGAEAPGDIGANGTASLPAALQKELAGLGLL